ncbi:hypothetical protein NDU88_001297 [Pleurodeles waltl]|uniref:Uncharacterized protein n=1 Tax=Pleurodeles waltl TaxID=8319 RepID=A0AAV7Q383_PLEWA|nr:hypothetical protein NDU88_001297 [Pleurodeles waltl]
MGTRDRGLLIFLQRQHSAVEISVRSAMRVRPPKATRGGSGAWGLGLGLSRTRARVDRELDCGKIWTACQAVEDNNSRQVDILGSGSCLVDFRPWSERPEILRARLGRHEAYNGDAEPLRWRGLGLGLGRGPPQLAERARKGAEKKGPTVSLPAVLT